MPKKSTNPPDHVQRRIGVGRAEEIDESAGTRAVAAQVIGGMRLKVVEHRQDRQRSDAGGGVRAVPVRAHVAVHRPAVFVGGHRDAAVDVRDDEVAVLVPAADLLGVELGHGLLVQAVRVRKAVHPLDAREPRVVVELVHGRGIEREGGLPELLRELPREHHPELGGVLRTVKALDGVVIDILVNVYDAARLGVRAAAAADERVDRMGIHALRLEHVEDHFAPEGHLVVDVRKLQKHGRFVEELPLEDRCLILEEADFRRSRAGVDGQYPEFTVFHSFSRKVNSIP